MDNAETALRHYEAVKRASRNYWNRKKEQKIADGTYRPRGRPRKTPTPPPSLKMDEVAVVQNPI